MAIEEWYYLNGTAQTGPVAVGTLRQMATRRAIRPDTFVWRSGTADWIQAVHAPELAGVFATGHGDRPPKRRHVLLRAMTFRGRFNRGEYWQVLITNVLMSLLCTIGVAIAPAARGGLQVFALLLLLIGAAWFLVSIPIGLGAAVQRLHDLGHSGWFLLLCVVPLVNLWLALVLMLRAGEPEGTTRWG